MYWNCTGENGRGVTFIPMGILYDEGKVVDKLVERLLYILLLAANNGKIKNSTSIPCLFCIGSKTKKIMLFAAAENWKVQLFLLEFHSMDVLKEKLTNLESTFVCIKKDKIKICLYLIKFLLFPFELNWPDISNKYVSYLSIWIDRKSIVRDCGQ